MAFIRYKDFKSPKIIQFDAVGGQLSPSARDTPFCNQAYASKNMGHLCWEHFKNQFWEGIVQLW
eukprot:100908-Pelagomonas_calceolata.AAC.7